MRTNWYKLAKGDYVLLNGELYRCQGKPKQGVLDGMAALEESVRGVPITCESLRLLHFYPWRNKWYERVGMPYRIVYRIGRYYLVVMNGRRVLRTFAKLQYLHELQHLLRSLRWHMVGKARRGEELPEWVRGYGDLPDVEPEPSYPRGKHPRKWD